MGFIEAIVVGEDDLGNKIKAEIARFRYSAPKSYKEDVLKSPEVIAWVFGLGKNYYNAPIKNAQ